MRAKPTLKTALAKYALYRDLAPETREWYGRIVGVFCSWVGQDDVLLDQFNGEAISRMLDQKQKAGRSQHYIKSLRNGMVAILRDVRGVKPCERVRTIKAPRIDVLAWTPKDIERLIKACAILPERRRKLWELIIAVSYYSGLDRCDVERLTQDDFADNGAIVFRRRKTKALVNVRIPMALLAKIRERRDTGPVINSGVSKEWFRKIFQRIVKEAGLFGSFKKLRKSSGSLVEEIAPGCGHRHLGNTRAVFERHYEAQLLTRSEPTMPPEIALPATLAESGVSHV